MKYAIETLKERLEQHELSFPLSPSIADLRSAIAVLEQSPKAFATMDKVASWLERLSESSSKKSAENRGRFDSLADACLADSKNYGAVAKEIRGAMLCNPSKELSNE